MIKFLTLFMTFTLASCSLLGERKNNAEYSIFTSIEGANVLRADGKSVGETPLVLGFEDIKDVVDGRFVSFIIEKPGYFTRVVFFDVTNSVNIKIDLKVDQEFKRKRQDELVVENKFLKDKNKYFEEQKKNFIETINNYKKQQEVYYKNMELLQKRLKTSEFNLNDYKTKYQKQAFAIKPVVISDSVPAVNIDLTASFAKELKQCRARVKSTKKVAAKRVKQRRCPSAKVRYYPTPRTNSIIRELLMAQFLIINNDHKQAKELILKLEENNPSVAALYTLLAYIETNSGNYTKAKRYLRKSLALDKKDKMAKRMMEMISSEQKGVIKSE